MYNSRPSNNVLPFVHCETLLHRKHILMWCPLKVRWVQLNNHHICRIVMYMTFSSHSLFLQTVTNGQIYDGEAAQLPQRIGRKMSLQMFTWSDRDKWMKDASVIFLCSSYKCNNIIYITILHLTMWYLLCNMKCCYEGNILDVMPNELCKSHKMKNNAVAMEQGF